MRRAVFTLLAVSAALGQTRISLVWKEAAPQARVEVARGTLAGQSGRGASRQDLEIRGGEAQYGPETTLVTVDAPKNPFTFFLRDVSRAYPVFIPAYGVAVTTADDPRDYAAIEADIRARGLQTKLGRIETDPEESFHTAAREVRSLQVQTWLGLGRDIRIFGVGERLDWVQPRFHGYEVPLPEAKDKPVRYNFLLGRGWGAKDDITRRLEDGTLPILDGRLVDDEITYDVTAFVGLEKSPVRADTVRGTHFLVADGYGHGHMFTPEQQKLHDSLLPKELAQPEETVLYVRAVAANTSQAPAYAFFKNAVPQGVPAAAWSYDGARGLARYGTGGVFAVARLNGKPLGQPEVAVQLRPGESATFEMFIPHRPIPEGRAAELAQQDFRARHEEVREYWRAKLARAAKIRLPEQRITEMVQAGLLHLDLITYGLEPDKTLTATIGVYSAIGSESSPIIQFMDSMGWHDEARRALMYFLDKQHDDGFIQNFGGYMLETGSALWSMGEHYRYTRDQAWVRQVAPKLIKACQYLQAWRQRNLRDDLRGKGYGMLEGKTADPEDPFRSFMLNGYAYLGMARVAEMLAAVDPAESRRWKSEADALKADIRSAAATVMGRSPVIPLRDGTWVPTLPPWVEYRGPLALYAEGGKWFTHGAMVSRDSLLGPLYLVFQEVLEPHEPASTFLLEFHNELMTVRNTAFSQPYYSRHPIVHLRRGEVKPFLKSYYNTMASLADRQTYTFWEHYFGASPHKTHEEGWFLMDTRWMLYMEKGDRLDLLPGVPRAFLENGKRISLDRVATYFGPASLQVASDLTHDRITAAVECATDRRPKTVEIRLPHPLGLKARAVKGGTYNPETERVRVENFSGKAEIVLEFGR